MPDLGRVWHCAIWLIPCFHGQVTCGIRLVIIFYPFHNFDLRNDPKKLAHGHGTKILGTINYLFFLDKFVEQLLLSMFSAKRRKKKPSPPAKIRWVPPAECPLPQASLPPSLPTETLVFSFPPIVHRAPSLSLSFTLDTSFFLLFFPLRFVMHCLFGFVGASNSNQACG